VKEAKFIKNVNPEANGKQKLYKLSVPIEYEEKQTTNYIVVSAANVMFSGIETYIFPSDKNGDILDWTELDGSKKGTISHEKVLIGAGYTII